MNVASMQYEGVASGLPYLPRRSISR
jgi:hypothetical protein